ncbi:MAG: histidine phosphatase family protein [Gemmatimonadota bacterium]|nr:histidine phosphatase family protein [Gemmatimonadota bacterium]
MTARRERILVFLRHADPVIDPGVPPSEWRLSEEGRERARGVADRLRGFAPVRCYTSPEPKARRTAELALEGSEAELVERTAFREHDRTGAAFFDDRTGFVQAIRDVFREPDRIVLGRESASAALRRFSDGVRAACRESPGNLVFVTHGTVMALFLAEVLKRDPFELWLALDFGALAAIAWPVPELVEWLPAG